MYNTPLGLALSDPTTGRTALHESCMGSDNSEVAEFLLESGAKVNAVNTEGETPLFKSIFYGNLEQSKVLLAAGAAVNHRRTNGNTPLDRALAQVAASTNAARAKIVEVLEIAGALTAVQLPDDDDDDNDNEDA